MNLRTYTKLNPYLFKISYGSKILSLGSCFSQNIGQKLQELKYNITQNPCGITFNSSSILTCIKTCISADSLPSDAFIKVGEMYCHSDFHGQFAHPQLDMAIENHNTSISNAKKSLQSIDTVILTLGTAWVFKEKLSGKVVNNCHKRPGSEFERVLLTEQEIFKDLLEVRELISKYSNCQVNYIITLSPVRHIRDGLIENQKSKARCLTAIHNMVDNFENVYYFPSYEILLDELRDYRFYKDDMVHPTNLALKYVFEKFEELALDESDNVLRDRITKIQNNVSHRPLFANTVSHQKFVDDTVRKITELENEYSFINFNEEKKRLKAFKQS